MNEIFSKFINNQYNMSKELSDDITDMNFNYLYLDEKVFKYEDIINKQVMLKGASSANDYYENLGNYTKVIVDHYFDIIIRNLREYIPKTWGMYFVRNLREKLRGYILSEICKFDLDELLREDPEVAKKRDYLINLNKILKNSERILTTDNEIKQFLKESNENETKDVKHPQTVESNKQFNKVNKEENKSIYSQTEANNYDSKKAFHD